MSDIFLPYTQARELIREGDVLLFRHQPREHWYSLPNVGWLIARYSGGIHSHAGIASWNKGRLKCVEFREWRGGRSVMLSSQIVEHPFKIDVFRPVSQITYPVATEPEKVCENRNGRGLSIKSFTKSFDYATAEKVTAEMDKLTGLPYGWKIIWQIAKSYLPFLRLAEKNVKDDSPKNIYVCSTALAYAFRKHYVDPIPYLADSATTPADLARSPLFHYLFTIGDLK